MEPVQAVECALSEDDFATYTDYVFGRAMNRWRFALMIALVLFAVPTLYGRWYVGDRLIQWDDFGSIAVFCGLLLARPILRWIARRQFRSAGFAKMREPRRIEISSDGLRSTGGIADSLTPWSSIIDIKVAPAGAYLFILKNNAHIVPRRAFADETTFKSFVAAAFGYWRPAGAAAT